MPLGAAARLMRPYRDQLDVLPPREREPPCYRRTNYHIQTVKTADLMNTETQAVLYVHCPMTKRHGTQTDEQVALQNADNLLSLAVDKGYDWTTSSEKLRKKDMRLLTKHRLF